MFSNFVSSDDGAVTIDWVALTAGIMLIGITLVYAIYGNGVASLAGTINDTMDVHGSLDPGSPPSQGTFQ